MSKHSPELRLHMSWAEPCPFNFRNKCPLLCHDHTEDLLHAAKTRKLISQLNVIYPHFSSVSISTVSVFWYLSVHDFLQVDNAIRWTCSWMQTRDQNERTQLLRLLTCAYSVPIIIQIHFHRVEAGVCKAPNSRSKIQDPKYTSYDWSDMQCILCCRWLSAVTPKLW